MSDRPIDLPAVGLARAHELPQGATLLTGGGVKFRLWAPGCDSVTVEYRATAGEPLQTCPMHPRGEGWYEAIVTRAAAGTRYQFVLPDGLHVPDPASRFQPDDVHGPSEVIDPRRYAWRDGGWAAAPGTRR